MRGHADYSDLSSLEREFELEMEGDDDLEFEFDREDEASDEEFESFDDSEYEEDEYESEGGYVGDYADRFLELSAREFESVAEVDQAMNEVLDDMEREYLFGSIGRGLKRLGKSKLLRSLAKKGLSAGVGKFFPGLQGALQLARGNLKGALLNFGKQALGTVVPGGAATLDAVKALGIGAGDASERETWDNYVSFAREAYEHLAENVTINADQPAEAIRLANGAVQHAIRQAQAQAQTQAHSQSRGQSRSGGQRRERDREGVRIVRLRIAPGEKVKLIITGA